MSDAPSSAPVYATPPAAVPGKTLGIVALILAFFFQLIALILGFVALSQSRKAGAKNTPAVVAIILSIVFGLIWIIGVTIAILGIVAVASQCADLGPGIHELNGVTYTCS